MRAQKVDSQKKGLRAESALRPEALKPGPEAYSFVTEHERLLTVAQRRAGTPCRPTGTRPSSRWRPPALQSASRPTRTITSPGRRPGARRGAALLDVGDDRAARCVVEPQLAARSAGVMFCSVMPKPAARSPARGVVVALARCAARRCASVSRSSSSTVTLTRPLLPVAHDAHRHGRARLGRRRPSAPARRGS